MEQLTPHTQLVAANEDSIRMIARADILRHSLVGTICRLLPSMPMGVWRDAMAKAKAVDMMDNADALTTCPQPKQQTQLLAA
jgi:hypothetical protein